MFCAKGCFVVREGVESMGSSSRKYKKRVFTMKGLLPATDLTGGLWFCIWKNSEEFLV